MTWGSRRRTRRPQHEKMLDSSWRWRDKSHGVRQGRASILHLVIKVKPWQGKKLQAPERARTPWKSFWKSSSSSLGRNLKQYFLKRTPNKENKPGSTGLVGTCDIPGPSFLVVLRSLWKTFNLKSREKLDQKPGGEEKWAPQPSRPPPKHQEKAEMGPRRGPDTPAKPW